MSHYPVNKVPKPAINPAASVIEDSILHYELSQAKVARAMKVSAPLLSDVIRGKKKVSVELALRLEACLGISAELLNKLQSAYDYQVSYHANHIAIEKEVEDLVPS